MGVTITDGSVGQAQVGISTLATVMASWLIPEEFRDRAVENVKILIVAAIEGSYIAQAFTFNSQSDALLTTLLIVAKKIDSPTNPKLPVAATNSRTYWKLYSHHRLYKTSLETLIFILLYNDFQKHECAYDNEDPITINTALSSPLLSRFDLILLTLDSPNQEWDNIAATYITEGIDLLGHGTLKKPWPITKMRDYFMIIKSAEPEMTPEAETIIKTYYAMSRRITENTDRHITVRQLESTVRLAQAHAKLTFSKQVNILDAIVAVLLMETSLNGCGKLLDKINALHTTFAEQPEQEYEGHVHLVLDWLNLPNLRDFELERIKHEYDQSTAWTENDEYEKRTMPREFKKPLPPPPPPTLLPTSTTSTTTLLLTQIAQREKQKEGTSHQRTEHYSTPLTTKPPVFNNKLSPIDKIGPLTRVNTQILVPIQENDSFDDQSQVKRRKIDDQTLELNAIKEDTTEEVCLSTIDDIQEDDLTY
ncbi:unnamed protein product [Rotaria sp. Silwood1]|nr:unnamed protein product [Rotaria sp. Silwood1]